MRLALIATVALANANPALAQPTYEIPYQGYLDLNGEPASGAAFELRFRLLDGTSAEVWRETVTTPVYKGAFSVILGLTTPLTGAELARVAFIAIDVKGPGDADFIALQGAQRLGHTALAARVTDLSVESGVYFDGNGAWFVNGGSTPTLEMELSPGLLRIDDLLLGRWQSNGSYLFLGSALLDQANAANYALLQHESIGTTYLNSPDSVRIRTDNADRITVDDSLVTVHGQLDVNGGLRCKQWASHVETGPTTSHPPYPSPAVAAELFQYGWICWNRSGSGHVSPTTVRTHNQYYNAWDVDEEVCGRISYMDPVAANPTILVHPEGGQYFGLRYLNGTNTYHGRWAAGGSEGSGVSGGVDYWSIWICR